MKRRLPLLWIALISFFATQTAFALSCVPVYDLNVSSTERDTQQFLLERKLSIKNAAWTALVHVEGSESLPIRTVWYSYKVVTVRIDRIYRVSPELHKIVRRGKTLSVRVPLETQIGSELLMTVNETPEASLKKAFARRKSEPNLASLGDAIPNRWYAISECFDGTYLKGSANFNALQAELELLRNAPHTLGELVPNVRGVYGEKQLVQIWDEAGKRKITQFSLGSWEAPTKLPAGRYQIDFPEVPNTGFSCFFDKPSEHRCTFEIESGFPTTQLGFYQQEAVPLIRLLDNRGELIKTTAVLRWYESGKTKTLPVRELNAKSYRFAEFQAGAIMHLKADWVEDDSQLFADEGECKAHDVRSEYIKAKPPGALISFNYAVFSPGFNILETEISPRKMGWIKVQFVGDLKGNSLHVEPVCNSSDHSLYLEELPATVFVPRGQSISYMVGSCCSSEKVLITVPVAINVTKQSW